MKRTHSQHASPTVRRRTTSASSSQPAARPDPSTLGPSCASAFFHSPTNAASAIKIYQCCKCRTVLGDSTSLLAVFENRLVLDVAMNVVSPHDRASWLTAPNPSLQATQNHYLARPLDAASEASEALEWKHGVLFTLLHCENCSETVGKIWRTQPQDSNRAFASKYQLEVEKLLKPVSVGGGKTVDASTAEPASSSAGATADDSAATSTPPVFQQLMLLLLSEREQREEMRTQLDQVMTWIETQKGIPRAVASQPTISSSSASRKKPVLVARGTSSNSNPRYIQPPAPRMDRHYEEIDAEDIGDEESISGEDTDEEPQQEKVFKPPQKRRK